jgi:membrane protein YqaA with SNARE-associated domain
MASIVELIFVLLTSFGFNLIPFAGPSNLFIASNAALVLNSTDPTTLVAIGFLVAFGAAFAKSIHYLVTFFIGKHLSKNRRERLDADAVKVRRWAFWLLYIAAATPIPDEPVVIPLGLMKYSITEFFTAFFLGKLSITIIGAFLGVWTKTALSEWLSPELTIALSVILTIVVTVILLKVDIGKLIERIAKVFKKKSTAKSKTPNPKQNESQLQKVTAEPPDQSRPHKRVSR